MDELLQEFPPIYGLDKNGKRKIWKASIYSRANPTTPGPNENAIFGVYIIEHGYVDGKLQKASREFREGKNIGRKNETTPIEQCTRELTKLRQDKIEKEGYSENIDALVSEPITTKAVVTKEALATIHSIVDNANKSDGPKKFFPMLAHKYDPNSSSKKKNPITYPCLVQPKLDGLRCVMYWDPKEKRVYNQSRTGSYFEALDHINIDLAAYFERHPNVVLDGELYTDEMPFEELAGLIKKKTHTPNDMERLSKVKYHVYDIYNREHPLLPFVGRHTLLIEDFPVSPHTKMVPTVSVANMTEFREMFTLFVEQGYEGIMLRNKSGIYRENYRSNDLQKYKEFFEDEYTIVGFKEGEGRDKGTVIWTCETADKRSFSVRPRGTIEARQQLYLDAPKQLGKKLTVIYQELSEMGIPRFPVGKAIRDGY